RRRDREPPHEPGEAPDGVAEKRQRERRDEVVAVEPHQLGVTGEVADPLDRPAARAGGEAPALVRVPAALARGGRIAGPVRVAVMAPVRAGPPEGPVCVAAQPSTASTSWKARPVRKLRWAK